MNTQNTGPGNEYDFDDEEAPDTPEGEDDDDNPFGAGKDGTDSGDDDDEEWELPPEPVGVLSGYTTAKKYTKDGANKIIVDVKITEPEFQKADSLTMWFDMTDGKDLARLLRFAAALGIAVEKRGRMISFPGGPEKAFHERTGKFLVVSWDKEDGTQEPQVAKWFQKPGKSQAWDQHMAELEEAGTPYTDEQMAILKKCPGVLPSDF